MSGKAGTFHSAKEVYIECRCVKYLRMYIYIIPYTAKAFSLGCNILKPKQAVETNIDMTPIVMLLKYIMEYADCSTVGAMRKCTTGSSTHE